MEMVISLFSYHHQSILSISARSTCRYNCYTIREQQQQSYSLYYHDGKQQQQQLYKILLQRFSYYYSNTSTNRKCFFSTKQMKPNKNAETVPESNRLSVLVTINNNGILTSPPLLPTQTSTIYTTISTIPVTNNTITTPASTLILNLLLLSDTNSTTSTRTSTRIHNNNIDTDNVMTITNKVNIDNVFQQKVSSSRSSSFPNSNNTSINNMCYTFHPIFVVSESDDHHNQYHRDDDHLQQLSLSLLLSSTDEKGTPTTTEQQQLEMLEVQWKKTLPSKLTVYSVSFLSTQFVIHYITIVSVFIGIQSGVIEPLVVIETIKSIGQYLYNTIFSSNSTTIASDPIPTTGTTGSTAITTTNQLVVDYLNQYNNSNSSYFYIPNSYIQFIQTNPSVTNFVIAWIIAKLVKPIRIALTLYITPYTIKYYLLYKKNKYYEQFS